ncbi:Sin3 histone deacetylase corepressor complex component SDS3 [Podila verticillata]|nr:Sin3 histone deacetylase corepressor complex component SDS3 [Podila verticillata]
MEGRNGITIPRGDYDVPLPRSSVQNRLLKLELELQENKHTLFDYQMARYKEEMHAILSGYHPDYQEQLQDLAAARDSTIEGAKLYRDYQLTSVDQRFAVETEATEAEYKAEREGLRDKMLAIIEAKRRALKEDNDHLDTINDTSLDVGRTTQRKLRKRGLDLEVGNKNKRNKTWPQVAKWSAPDTEALNDLSSIYKTSPSAMAKKSGALRRK